MAVKVNAPSLLRRELRRRAERRGSGFIAVSSSTEPWQEVENEYKVARRCLEVIRDYRFPVHALTKSEIVLRDLDVLRDIDEKAYLPPDLAKIRRDAFITISLSTLDEEIAQVFKPRAPKPQERLDALKAIVDEEFLVGPAYIPVLPFISDGDDYLDQMIRAVKEVSACYVFVGALTLFGAGKQMFYKVLEKRFPELLPRYDQLFGASHQPNRFYQYRLEKKAKKLCEKHSVKYRILP